MNCPQGYGPYSCDNKGNHYAGDPYDIESRFLGHGTFAIARVVRFIVESLYYAVFCQLARRLHFVLAALVRQLLVNQIHSWVSIPLLS